MEHPYTASLIIDILRRTLQRLEETAGLVSDDPAVIELRRHIVQSIAELEINRNLEPSSKPKEPKGIPSTLS